MKIRPGAGRDPPPETRLDAWEFAAKSKTARRFVTLGPPRGCPTVRGGQRGGGSPPRGVRGAASATATEGAGPGTGRDAPLETRLEVWEFAAKSKTTPRLSSSWLSTTTT